MQCFLCLSCSSSFFFHWMRHWNWNGFFDLCETGLGVSAAPPEAEACLGVGAPHSGRVANDLLEAFLEVVCQVAFQGAFLAAVASFPAAEAWSSSAAEHLAFLAAACLALERMVVLQVDLERETLRCLLVPVALPHQLPPLESWLDLSPSPTHSEQRSHL